MPRVLITTSIDITRTNVRNRTAVDDWQLKRNQQRNYDTLIQVLCLRTQPLISDEKTFEGDPKRYGLGSELVSPSKLWQVVAEYPDFEVFGGDKIPLLLEDLNNVPMVIQLSETKPSDRFLISGPAKNISAHILTTSIPLNTL